VVDQSCTRFAQSPVDDSGNLLTGDKEQWIALSPILDVLGHIEDCARTDPMGPMGYTPFENKGHEEFQKLLKKLTQDLLEITFEARLKEANATMPPPCTPKEEHERRSEIWATTTAPAVLHVVYTNPNLGGKRPQGKEQIVYATLFRLLATLPVQLGSLPCPILPLGPDCGVRLVPRVTHVIVAHANTTLGPFRNAHPVESLHHTPLATVFSSPPLYLGDLFVPRGTHYVFELVDPETQEPIPGIGHSTIVSSQCAEGDSLGAAIFTLMIDLVEHSDQTRKYRSWPNSLNLPDSFPLLGAASGHCFVEDNLANWLAHAGAPF